MKTGQAGLNLIKKWEGCSLKAVKLAGEKYYTIGYGHSFDSSITKSTVWTKAQAEAQLKIDLRKFEQYVEKYVPVKLNQNQFDALVSYTYNRGVGGLKQLVANCKTISDYPTNIVKYWGSATRYKTGLVNRRKEEASLFLKGMDKNMDTLRNGDTGTQVKCLQKLLGGLTIDGVFGKNTETKVKEFQTKNGLELDGIVGEKTWSVILN